MSRVPSSDTSATPPHVPYEQSGQLNYVRVSRSAPDDKFLKILVSNNTAGCIIGKSGQAIAELQQSTSCRIKISQSGDYFPGTNERVCLIAAKEDFMRAGLEAILRKFREVSYWRELVLM